MYHNHRKAALGNWYEVLFERILSKHDESNFVICKEKGSIWLINLDKDSLESFKLYLRYFCLFIKLMTGKTRVWFCIAYPLYTLFSFSFSDAKLLNHNDCLILRIKIEGCVVKIYCFNNFIIWCIWWKYWLAFGLHYF